MIRIDGYCIGCGKYYQLPKDDEYADVTIHLPPAGQASVYILCSDQKACHENRVKNIRVIDPGKYLA